MITSLLSNDIRILSKEIAIFLRSSSDRAFASEILSALGACVCSISEISGENPPTVNSRLTHSALTALKRVDTLVEIGTDGGVIPEAKGNVWLRRCRTLIPRLKNAYADSRRKAGLSFRLPKSDVLFTTARLTVRTVDESDLKFIVTLLNDGECLVYGVTPPHCCDSARELVRDGSVSVIARGDGERVGIIFCSLDANVEGRCWLKSVIAVRHRGMGYSLEAIDGFGVYAYENRSASVLSVYAPASIRNYAEALRRYGYTSERVGNGFVADQNINIDRTLCL